MEQLFEQVLRFAKPMTYYLFVTELKGFGTIFLKGVLCMDGIQWVERFTCALADKGRRPSTVRRYRYDLLDFFKWLGDKDFHSMEQTDAERYFYELIKERSYQTRTIRRVASVLRQFTAFLMAEKRLASHPLLTYDPPPLETEPLQPHEWVNAKEIAAILRSSQSEEGLTDNQLLARPQLTKRNFALFLLLAHYGLTLQELCDLQMNDVNFVKGTLLIRRDSGNDRQLALCPKNAKQLHAYWTLIPEPVRPRLHTDDPLFVAFDFTRRTYHWSYENDAPKALTEIALQKMIRTEVARAGLRKGISAQHFRHSFLLKLMLAGEQWTTIQQKAGLKSMLSLRRYALTVKKMNVARRQELLPTATETGTDSHLSSS